MVMWWAFVRKGMGSGISHFSGARRHECPLGITQFERERY